MLTPEILSRLTVIVDQDEWQDGYRDFDTSAKVFGVLCDLLEEFGDGGKELALSFLSKYRLLTNYTKPLRTILKKLPDGFFSAGPVYLFPPRRADGTSIKSGHHVGYELETCTILPDTVELIENIFSPKILISPHHRYVAIDDFIGTGDQLSEAVTHLLERGVLANQIAVISICIQKDALERFQKLGLSVFAWEVRPKAISDSYAIGNLTPAEAKVTYELMAVDLDIDVDELFGYGQSEALVSMKRTPDNTLSIFWHSEKKGGAKWPAPFPR